MFFLAAAVFAYLSHFLEGELSFRVNILIVLVLILYLRVEYTPGIDKIIDK